jgi:glycerol-3-phosphate cytidylyltransferase
MKIGFTCGAFDVMHAGHVLMLKEAKSVCDYLIVGLQIDPSIDRANKARPIQSLFERHLQLDACKYVDEIVLYETEDDLMMLLQNLPIDIRIVGEDHRNKPFTGDELEIEIYFNSRQHNFSSTNLKKKLNGKD